jgi:hypothetical protein
MEMSGMLVIYHIIKIKTSLGKDLLKEKKLDQLKDYMCLDNVCVGSK